jgi:hypothetical protein
MHGLILLAACSASPGTPAHEGVPTRTSGLSLANQATAEAILTQVRTPVARLRGP